MLQLGAGFLGLALLGVAGFFIVRMIDGPREASADQTEVSEASSAEGAPPASITRGDSRGAKRSQATQTAQPLVIAQGPVNGASGSNAIASQQDTGRTGSSADTRSSSTNEPVAQQSEASDSSSPSLLGDALRRGREGSSTLAAPPREIAREQQATDVTTRTATTSLVQRALDATEQLVRENNALAARDLLNTAMNDPSLTISERGRVRQRLSELNRDLVFGPTAIAGDPLSETYVVESGDSLSRIARKRELGTHWKLIQRVNGLTDPRRIRVGQSIKLVRGPFNVVVDKSEYRLDLFHGPPDDPAQWMFVKSFTVGLGEGDSTPLGTFIVRENGKLENPGWVNPRNPAEKYDPDDERNPVGEFWVGIEGVGEDAIYTGYGLHGTIEPQTIGTQASMGCVRMFPDDIAMMYETLTEGISRVIIRR
ncbi:MAG: L,D-transpeptidase family protein [Planctomycetota bacterium]